MAERFNTRNVAQKEIYDSYMGILRISPNEVNGSIVDDATQILNTLYDEDKKKRTTIILSDSNGTILPITFQPRAFETLTIERNQKTGVDFEKEVDLLNVATLIGIDGNEGQGDLFVSDTMKMRSTLILTRKNNEDEIDCRHSLLRILSGGEPSVSSLSIEGTGWLLYPSESPNDDNYINAKNRWRLFSEEDDTPRYKQVETNLNKWKRNSHNKIPATERVIAGGRSVSIINDYNEEVPVYYTRDYILGHYDGHQIKSGIENTMHTNWGINGDSSEGKTDYVTKLSWTRFDKLIWESLDEILSGQVRHVKGRYDELGTNESADPGIREALGFGNSLEYKDFAPILGTEMPRGMIAYNAMPFHRYWYYRTRQALRAFVERRKGELSQAELEAIDESQSLDTYILKNHGLNDGSYQQECFQYNEILNLQRFYENELITPCSMGTVGFAHSLGKNFVLCNGCTINFQNFPNISLTNEAIFNTSQTDTSKNDENGNPVESEFLTDVRGNVVFGGVAHYDKTFGFEHKTSFGNSALGSIAMSSTGTDNCIKLPNLFALYEKTPRFIRGLNWKVEDSEEVTNVFTKSIGADVSNYVKQSNKTNDALMQIVSDEIINEDGSYAHRIPKKLEVTNKIFFHTYDHLEEKEEHQHRMFSGIQGGVGTNYVNKILHMYHCFNTRGGHVNHMNHWTYCNMMNFDRTYSTPNWSISPSSYKLGLGEGFNDADQKSTFLKYCAGEIYKGGLYEEFTPIPNLGLYIFNASIFNNKGVTEYIGKPIVKKDDSTTEDDKTPVETSYDFSRGTSISDTTDKETKKRTNNNIEKALGDTSSVRFGFVDATGVEHLLDEEAPISTETFEIEEPSWEKLQEHDAEKQRRKFYAMKMNEAEGFVPISYAGKASGYVELAWSRDERSGSKSSSRNTYHDVKKNVASYIMGGVNPTENTYWRCMTSIAYNNSHKLGVGDIKNYINNRKNYDENTDYYDVNCVTQLIKDEKYKKYYFGDVGIEVDESCPSPNTLNLLPLIRI